VANCGDYGNLKTGVSFFNKALKMLVEDWQQQPAAGSYSGGQQHPSR